MKFLPTAYRRICSTHLRPCPRNRGDRSNARLRICRRRVVWRARQAQNVVTYGSARWATSPEMASAGLFADAGPFLGKYRGHYIRHSGPEHIIAFAPTRSGKGVGLVVPTLLGWTGSAVIHDIKGENWSLPLIAMEACCGAHIWAACWPRRVTRSG